MTDAVKLTVSSSARSEQHRDMLVQQNGMQFGAENIPNFGLQRDRAAQLQSNQQQHFCNQDLTCSAQSG